MTVTNSICLAVPHAPGVAHVGAEAQPPSSLKKPFPPLLARKAVHWARPIPPPSHIPQHNLILLVVGSIMFTAEGHTLPCMYTCQHTLVHTTLDQPELQYSLLQCHGRALLMRPFLLTSASSHSWKRASHRQHLHSQIQNVLLSSLSSPWSK